MSDRPGRLVLLGHPVGHSLSPLFQNAALRSAGIPLVFEALDVPPANLAQTLRSLITERAAGNVTIPHKVAVRDACATLTPLARRVGAVNCFWTADGVLAGDNTDVAGFDSLARSVAGPPKGERVALLGAGGAAAAVLAAIEQWRDARVRSVARSAEKGTALAARFSTFATSTTLAEALRGATMVVNATPVGMRDDEHPLPLDQVPRGAVVLDLVYRRGGTAWSNAATSQGHVASDGLPMLIAQGAAAFKRWFGIEPDLDAMREAIE